MSTLTKEATRKMACWACQGDPGNLRPREALPCKAHVQPRGPGWCRGDNQSSSVGNFHSCPGDLSESQEGEWSECILSHSMLLSPAIQEMGACFLKRCET